MGTGEEWLEMAGFPWFARFVRVPIQLERQEQAGRVTTRVMDACRGSPPGLFRFLDRQGMRIGMTAMQTIQLVVPLRGLSPIPCCAPLILGGRLNTADGYEIQFDVTVQKAKGMIRFTNANTNKSGFKHGLKVARFRALLDANGNTMREVGP